MKEWIQKIEMVTSVTNHIIVSTFLDIYHRCTAACLRPLNFVCTCIDVCVWKLRQKKCGFISVTSPHECVRHLFRQLFSQDPSHQTSGPWALSARPSAQLWGNPAGGEGNEPNLLPPPLLPLTHTVVTRTLMHAWFHTGTRLCMMYIHICTSEACGVAALTGGSMHGRCRVLSSPEVL